MAHMAIKDNFLGGDHFCGLCGASFKTCFGPDLFLEGTMQPVCRSCGREYAPHLVELLKLAENAVVYSQHCAD
jgi:hypothetical protein